MFIKAKAVSPCNELENIYHVREEQLKKNATKSTAREIGPLLRTWDQFSIGTSATDKGVTRTIDL